MDGTMRALVVKRHGEPQGALALEERPIPSPGPGQVLVHVGASPINPSDLLALRDAYQVKKPIGAIAGFEASGTVVEGRGLFARSLVGRRVAFVVEEGEGTWAEYACTGASRCVPLRAAVDLDAGSMLLSNPLTAVVLVNQARREGHRAIVQGGAAGALGTMISRLCARHGLPLVNVVRSEAHVKELRAAGARHALDLGATDFDDRLAALCRELGATLALDPVGGALTGRFVRALDPGGVVRVYGLLSGEPCHVPIDDLVYGNKRVEGFTIYDWVKKTSFARQVWTIMGVQSRLGKELATEIRARFPLDRHEEALGDYAARMSGGKILFVTS